MQGHMGAQAKAGADAGLMSGAGVAIATAAPRFRFEVECFDADGNLKWREDVRNLVTTVGKNHLIDSGFRAQSQITTWYVGLVDTASPTFAAGDTMGSHAGWTEFTSYDETLRRTLTLAAASSGSSDNSANKAVFTISGSGTVGGAFVTSGSAKSGTTGTLYGEADFSTDRVVADNDVLNVTVTLSM